MARPKKQVTSENIETEIDDSKELSIKDKEFDLALAEVEKEFGKGSVMTLLGYKDTSPVCHISSGSVAVDIILGKGGFTFGRNVEIFGPEGAGKTTLTLGVIARAQKLGLRCLLVDKEGSLDPDYASALGVNLKNMLYCQPDTAEEALGIIERFINSGTVDVIVLDSIAALNPSADLEKSLTENAKMAGRAAILTRFFERNDTRISKNKILFIYTNQLREGLNPYGAKEVTGGGRALKHAGSYRLDIRPVEKLKDENGDIIGVQVRIKTMKNKMNSPYKEATYDLIFGKGIDKIKDLVDVAIQIGLVEKGGSWFNYKDNKFQGFNGIREYLSKEENFEILYKEVLNIVGPDWGPEGR